MCFPGGIFSAGDFCALLTVPAPVEIGDVLLADIAGTGVALIATKSVAKK